MKLLTICDKEQSILNGLMEGVNFNDYTMDDYKRFMETAKKYYVSMRHYWYETDMSDHDSGTRYKDFSINNSNMIIKDNELYGVLVSTFAMFPKFKILKLENKHTSLALGGGYNSDDYDWWLKDNDMTNLDTLEVSLKYILIKEKKVYITLNNNKQLSRIERDVIGFIQDNCIVEDGKVIGLSHGKSRFIFDDKESLSIVEE